MQNDLTKRIYWYFGLMMVIIIVAMGITLLTTDVLYDTIQKPRRTWLGWIFLIYGAFRGMRVYTQFKQFKSDRDE